MNQFILFIPVIVYASIIQPVEGYLKTKKARSGQTGEMKIAGYRSTILWAWIPVLSILVLMPLFGIRPGDLGIRGINIGKAQAAPWLKYALLAVSALYAMYNIYCILSLKLSNQTRREASARIPEEIKIYLPISNREKRMWTFVALSAGVTEEILYRGYLMYSLAFFFPQLPWIGVLLISSAVFGLGHIYQGVEAVKPMVLGFFFGLLYIAFDSILPVMVLHILQDMVVKYLVDEEIVSCVGEGLNAEKAPSSAMPAMEEGEGRRG